MSRNKLHLAILAIAIAGVTVLTSCKKKETVTPATTTADSDASGASANSKAEEISSDIISIGSQACDKTSGGLSGYRTAETEGASQLSCATVTVDTINKVVTVTFSGNVCLDGKTRTGSLIYNYSASPVGAKHYRDPGFTVNVSSNNYAVDNNTVTIINKTISNVTPVGFNPLTTNETWSVTANISIALSGGGSISWTCTRVKTLLNTASAYSNASTPIAWSTARVGFTGSASGSRSNGETFTVNITSQLIRDWGNCMVGLRHPFIQGTFVYSPSGKAARTFDYGTGTCDLNATVTINGISYPIVL